MRLFCLFVACMLGTTVRADLISEKLAESCRLEKSKDYAGAIQALATAQPPNYTVNARLGWLHYLQGNPELSIRYYERAIRSAPTAIEPRLGLLLPLMAQQRFAEAEIAAKAVLVIDSRNYTASLRLTTALRMQSKFIAARKTNSMLLELYPTDVSFLTEQLLTSIASKNSDVSSLCQTILALDPENSIAKSQLLALAR